MNPIKLVGIDSVEIAVGGGEGVGGVEGREDVPLSGRSEIEADRLDRISNEGTKPDNSNDLRVGGEGGERRGGGGEMEADLKGASAMHLVTQARTQNYKKI